MRRMIMESAEWIGELVIDGMSAFLGAAAVTVSLRFLAEFLSVG